MSFGCSWAYGDELSKPLLTPSIDPPYIENSSHREQRRYLGLLAKHYNASYDDMSFPGSSLQTMQWNLLYWLNNNTRDCIANSILLVGLTGEERVSWYNPAHETDSSVDKYVYSTWLNSAGPSVDNGWFKLHKYHTAMTACKQTSKLNYETTVRLFDGISKTHNIPVIQFNTVATSQVKNVGTFHDLQLRKCLCDEHYASGGHPNEKGHQLIANKLINIINTLKK